jgi:mono/diheme cytochrome c family protein
MVSPASAQTSGVEIYKSKCVLCHGDAGLGDTSVGKAMKAASYKDPAVVKATDAELTAVVKNGKGNMAAFGKTLTDAQIKAVIAYVRTLQK